MRRRLAVWSLVLAGWTVIAVVFAVSSSLTYALTYQAPQWSRTLVASLTEWYAWAALTPAVAWVATRFRFERRRWIRRLVTIGAIGIPVAIVKVMLTRVLRSAAGVAEYVVITNLATHYFIYWGMIGAVHALHIYQAGRARELRASQLEASLAAARLQLLTMQLQPHFLFNTLNAIAELVHESPAAAERMIGGLSRLLRETLDTTLDDVVPLARELDLLERYLEIQRVRFGDRLDVRVVVDAEARAALVPALLLQPLVENSIKHGLAVRTRAGRIDIRAERRAGWLMLEVEDDGEGFGAADVQEGVGLGNTKARLAALYKDAHTFDVSRAASGGAIVRMGIPWSAGPTGGADLSRRSSRPIQRSEGG